MTASFISRTGRVQSWLDNPESRLASKHRGDMYRMDSDLARELRSIYQSSVPKEQKTAKVLQLLALYPLEKSTQA
jgi:hypothetical protein